MGALAFMQRTRRESRYGDFYKCNTRLFDMQQGQPGLHYKYTEI
jgi:hypothetical protein